MRLYGSQDLTAAFLYIFTIEMAVKIFAYGFVAHRGTYLRDPWCMLDFVVVTLAWAPVLFPSFGNYSVIRCVRALRPLRALKRMPGMPKLVNSILSVLPRIGNVLLLCAFVFFVFGIVGMELFKGELHYRCAADLQSPLGADPQKARRQMVAFQEWDTLTSMELVTRGLRSLGENLGGPFASVQQPGCVGQANLPLLRCEYAHYSLFTT